MKRESGTSPSGESMRLFRDLRRQVDRAFAQILEEPWGRIDPAAWHPAVDLFEEEGDYHVVADLPGVPPDRVELRMEDSGLVLCGTRAAVAAAASGRAVWIERRAGRFCRSFRLDKPVDMDRVEVRQEGGVYHFRIPKRMDRARESGADE